MVDITIVNGVYDQFITIVIIVMVDITNYSIHGVNLKQRSHHWKTTMLLGKLDEEWDFYEWFQTIMMIRLRI